MAVLHQPCHSKIHSVLSEKALARDYNSIEKLLQHVDIARFAKWIARRPIDFSGGSRRMKSG
ncbi:MAG: hypothetical protein AAGJ79_12885 [Verrucomicrobiota bacterium]